MNNNIIIILVLMADKQIMESARGIHSAMVQNPIYEGPLYETLETQFNVINPLAVSTSVVNTSTETTNNSSNSSPTLRYVEQPRCTMSCTPQNQPSLSQTHLSSTAPAVEDHSVPVSEQLQENGNHLKPLATVPLDMEEKYTIMTPTKTVCSGDHAQKK